MKIKIHTLFTLFFLMITLTVFSRNDYLEKKIILTNGSFSLKDVLKTLSDQTACVFSYDPTKVNDNKTITTSAGTYTLQSALQKILPPNIQYKMTGKYVVLQKASTGNSTDLKIAPNPVSKVVQVVMNVNNTPDKTLKDSIILPPVETPQRVDFKDTTEVFVNSGINKDEIITDQQIAPEILVESPLKDSVVSIEQKEDSVIQGGNATVKSKFRPKSIFELELAADNHLRTISTHWGLSSVYGIFSLGGDYKQSYHMGIGIGTGFKIYKRLGMNIDLSEFAIVGGRSRRVNISAYTTQFTPTLIYKIGQHWKISLGPTFYTINSGYKNGSTSTNLGRYSGSSGIVGLTYNFNSYQ